MKQIKLNYKNDLPEEYFVPDASSFKAVSSSEFQGERKRANRVPVTKFTPGQKYAGVLIRKKLDHQGQFGVADLFYFKRLLGGSSQQNNIVLSEDDDMIAVDNNVVLKQELRKIEEGTLVVIEYKGQAPPPKRYKMWGIYVDVNYKNQMTASKPYATAGTSNQQFAQPQVNNINQFIQQNDTNNRFTPNENKTQAHQQHNPFSYSKVDDDVPF